MPTATSSPATPEQLRDLGVAWMNRGHELMVQGNRVSLEASLVAYNEAITVLRQLPTAENLGWTNSLGAALMNRGQLLHRLHGIEQATVALAAFDEAAGLLRPLASSPDLRISPWPRRNLTGTLLNRSSLLLDLGQFSIAAATAREALALTTRHERLNLVDADLALKTRRCLCDAIGRLIVEPNADQNALAAEASDLVDEALTLIRHWAANHPAAFASLAVRFFRYGAQLYRLHQPHFLTEFILENVSAADPQLHPIAIEALDSALSDGARNQSTFTIGDPATERRLQTWRDLTHARTLLADLAPVG